MFYQNHKVITKLMTITDNQVQVKIVHHTFHKSVLNTCIYMYDHVHVYVCVVILQDCQK